MIDAVPESQMVIFSPKNPLYTITVFTDVDCQYCRKLHSEMAELNRLGVRVRYMFYPRTGPNTESWRKAEVVWCSADRNEALTQREGRGPARHEQDLRSEAGGARIRAGPEHRRARHAGDRHGERRLHQGYMPPRELVQEIKQLQVAKRETGAAARTALR